VLPRVSIQRLPKCGSTAAEYEDAVAASYRDGPPFRFAVADGASESSFARSWAELLAGAYVDGGLTPASWRADLVPLQRAWCEAVSRRPLAWHAAAKARAGAFAALAGLTLTADGGWTALAVGDSCVLHERGDALRSAFPLARSCEFDRRPVLLSSNAERNMDAGALACTAGTWAPGDRFYLLSDALACYVLGRVEAGQSVGAALPFSHRTVRFWLARQRERRAIRNDDVSLIAVQVT
jgi:hypothetical protein